MSKLFTILQFLATGPVTVSSPWPHRLLRRMAIGVSLVITGSILTGVLITAALFLGYQNALAQGYQSNEIIMTVIAILTVIIIGIGIGVAYCIKGIKGQFRPFSSRPATLGGQVAHTVSNTVQDAVKGFAEGFSRGTNRASSTYYR